MFSHRDQWSMQSAFQFQSCLICNYWNRRGSHDTKKPWRYELSSKKMQKRLEKSKGHILKRMQEWDVDRKYRAIREKNNRGRWTCRSRWWKTTYECKDVGGYWNQNWKSELTYQSGLAKWLRSSVELPEVKYKKPFLIDTECSQPWVLKGLSRWENPPLREFWINRDVGWGGGGIN